jgi:heme/copper-type cytochrome/quinol oxidase subunit 4
LQKKTRKKRLNILSKPAALPVVPFFFMQGEEQSSWASLICAFGVIITLLVIIFGATWALSY